MAMLTHETVEVIRGVADAYTARERERLSMPDQSSSDSVASEPLPAKATPEMIRAGWWFLTRRGQHLDNEQVADLWAEMLAAKRPTAEGELREALEASLAKRSQPTMDPLYTAAFNAALDMVARDTAAARADLPAPVRAGDTA